MPRRVIERTPTESTHAVRASAGTLLLLEQKTQRALHAAFDEAVDEAVAGATRERKSKAALLALLLLASKTYGEKARAAIRDGRQRARRGARKRFIAELAAIGIVLEGQFGHGGHREDEDDGHAHAAADALAIAWRAAVIHAVLRARRRGESIAEAIDETRARVGGPNRTAATETARSYNDEHRVAAAEAIDEIAEAYPDLAPWLVRMWSAILDRFVCMACKAHDGEVTELGGHFEGGDEPGDLHPHCRCIDTIVVLPKSMRRHAA